MQAPASGLPVVYYAPSAANPGGVSNVVSSSDSKTVTLAQSLSILTLEKGYLLDPTCKTLHCYAEISPANTTYRQVNWSVIAGSDLATIDASGVLVYTGKGKNGSVTVKATAADGSGVSNTRNIRVSDFTAEIMAESVSVYAAYSALSPSLPSVTLTAVVQPDNVSNSAVEWSVARGAGIVGVDAYGYVTALGRNGTAVVRATAADGSGVYGEIGLTVSGYGDTEYVYVSDINVTAPYVMLVPENDGTVVLSAEVLPDNADNRNVVWSVRSGADLVSVTPSGSTVTVVAKGNRDGRAVVRATAADGSGVYGEIELSVEGFALTAVDDAERRPAVLYPVPAQEFVNIRCDYPVASVEIIAADGSRLVLLDGNITHVDVSTLAQGVYLMRITSADGLVELRRFSVVR